MKNVYNNPSLWRYKTPAFSFLRGIEPACIFAVATVPGRKGPVEYLCAFSSVSEAAASFRHTVARPALLDTLGLEDMPDEALYNCLVLCPTKGRARQGTEKFAMYQAAGHIHGEYEALLGVTNTFTEIYQRYDDGRWAYRLFPSREAFEEYRDSHPLVLHTLPRFASEEEAERVLRAALETTSWETALCVNAEGEPRVYTCPKNLVEEERLHAAIRSLLVQNVTPLAQWCCAKGSFLHIEGPLTSPIAGLRTPEGKTPQDPDTLRLVLRRDRLGTSAYGLFLSSVSVYTQPR